MDAETEVPQPDQIAALLVAGPFMVLVIDGSAVIRFASDAAEPLLGLAPEQLVGTVAFDRVHPDDRDRALLSMSWLTDGRSLPSGVTTFRGLHADGHWVELETVASTTDVLGEPAAVIWARELPARQAVVEDVFHRLTAGDDPEAILRRVCDFVLWRDWGTQVGISWVADGEGHWCSTGAPAELVSGGGDGSPWDRARTGRTAVEATVAELDAPRRAQAAALALREVRVEALDWGAPEPALISVWTTGGGVTPAHHQFGVSQIRTIAELVLRWTAQSEELERTARTDALTGLANRRAFFEHLDAGAGPGAVVYCDLDGFKPVNDAMGHAAGDRVLQVVAERIAGSVRRQDLVARLGGDEFVVLCPGLDAAGADALVARLRSEVDRPIDVDGTSVVVGLSVGVAHALDTLDDDALNRADDALYAAKRRHPAPGPGPSRR